MLFQDLTRPHEPETNLSKEQLQLLIEKETGRKLVFVFESLVKNYDTYFKLLKFPAPLGFVFAANKPIPKGTVLCAYGGELLRIERDKANFEDINYLLEDPTAQILDPGYEHFFQASNAGDIGSMLVHLPDDEFLERFGIDEIDKEKIQKSNLGLVKQQGHIVFRTLSDVKAGALLGYSYGLNYFVNAQISPCFFKEGKAEILSAEALNCERFLCIKASTIHAKNEANVGVRLSQINWKVLERPITTTFGPIAAGERIYSEEVGKGIMPLVVTPSLLAKGQASNSLLFFTHKTCQMTYGCEPPANSEIRDSMTFIK